MEQSRNHLHEVTVVIPAYNESSRISRVIQKLKLLGFPEIVVVDDGSHDNTFEVAEKEGGVKVIRHVVNLGPGASTMTGIKYALQHDARFIATIDADFQSDPSDLLKLVQSIKEKGVELLIGSRFMTKNDIPVSRQIYNFFGNLVSFFKTGLLVSDSQSGLKVMRRSFAEKLYIDYNGFEFCIDIIKKAKLNRASVAEEPIGVSYTRDTMSKGQYFQEGLMMLGKLLNPFGDQA